MDLLCKTFSCKISTWSWSAAKKFKWELQFRIVLSNKHFQKCHRYVLETVLCWFDDCFLFWVELILLFILMKGSALNHLCNWLFWSFHCMKLVCLLRVFHYMCHSSFWLLSNSWWSLFCLIGHHIIFCLGFVSLYWWKVLLRNYANWPFLVWIVQIYWELFIYWCASKCWNCLTDSMLASCFTD